MPNKVAQSWDRLISTTFLTTEFGAGAVVFIAWAMDAGNSGMEIQGFDAWVDIGQANIHPNSEIQVVLLDSTFLSVDSSEPADALYVARNAVFMIREKFADRFGRIRDTFIPPLQLPAGRKVSMFVRPGLGIVPPPPQTVEAGLTVYGGLVGTKLSPRLREGV